MSRIKICFAGIALLSFVLAFFIPQSSAQSSSDNNEFEFVGRIMKLPSTTGFVGDWTVGLRTVHVTSATQIDQEDGAVAVGALVEVEGTLRSDGSVDANEIEVEQAASPCLEFTGTIQNLPNTAGFIGDWTVSGQVVHVTSATVIDTEEGIIAVGKLVKVQGCRRSDGSIDASRIEIEDEEEAHLDCLEFSGVIEALPA